MTDALFITSDGTDGLATPAEYVDVVRDGYRQRGEGAPALPRQTLHHESPDGELTHYSAILPETGAMGGYMYTLGFAGPNAWFVTPVFDAESGEPLALIDGASMNPFKTGAAGAVAVDALARDDASTVGLIGSGAQARGQLHATATVRDLESVRVFSPTPDNRAAFAAEFDDHLEAAVESVDSSAAAVSGADVVITATTAADPVFDGDDLQPGTHVTAMGQHTPDRRELDTTTIERSTYVPDLRARVIQDAGSYLAALEAGVIDEDHVHAELGEVVAGVASGRTSDDEITVFDSGGTGIETVAAAHMLYEKARAEGLGSEIPIAPASEALTGRLP
ncbi:ornithine cyclodeaminase family protein [Natrinema sp. 1APR25-10V2]|uniref:ornithine cyclodeaminase family protein n=1 Tax=Natrinema sp. 1APR25-10V2 TaxID=2951081 RepID=UPI0028771D6A|nr:ornithine cyclodeaminase family protein [Natrinema sp. 1APR25-10V2]MDS0477072.1 ornithine cyclodeaminase family protein [Natrinema sp. 1APR25-10V2]